MSKLEDKFLEEVFNPIPPTVQPDFPESLVDREPYEEIDYSIEPDDAIVKAQDQAQAATEESATSLSKRLDWISDIESSNEGWKYWYDHPDVRNVFYKTTVLEIGGGLNPAKDIACSAVTVNFGHRIAKHRLIGQDTPSWQFLGAGNKSGTIVFRAGNEGGRRTLGKIRAMYRTAQDNARLYKYAPDAQTFTIYHTDVYNANNVNNVLALADINKIIVTNVDHQTDAGGVDLDTLVMEFITFETTNENLQLRDVISPGLKFSMIRSLLKHLKSFQRANQDVEGHEANAITFVKIKKHLEKVDNFVRGVVGREVDLDQEQALDIQQRLLEFFAVKQSRHFISPKSSVLNWTSEEGWKPSKEYEGKEWFAGLVLEVHRIVTEHKTDFPLLITPFIGGKKGETWEDKLRNDLGEVAIELFGGSKDPIPLFGALEGFHHYGIQKNHTVASKAYAVITRKLDQVIRKAMKHVSDPDNFKSKACFGENAYNAILSSAVSQAGECYLDLDLPEAPGYQGFKLDPEFYVYDDSMENAILGSSNDPKNMEALIQSQIQNEAKSLEDFTARILFGGQGTSLNMARIRDTKLRLNEALGSEYGFLSMNNSKQQTLGGNVLNQRGFFNLMLGEGLKKWDSVIHDLSGSVSDTDTRPEEVIYKRYKESGKEEGGTERQQIFNGYLNMVVDMQPSLRNFVDRRDKGAISSTDKGALKSIIKKSVFGQLNDKGEVVLPKSIKFGPNEEQIKGDALRAGVPDPNAEETVGGINNPEVYVSDLTLERDLGHPWEGVSGEIPPAYDVPPPVDPDSTHSPVETTSSDVLWAKQAAAVAVGTRKRDLSMRRAYPTFKIYFIEEDSEQGNTVFRAFDDFYGYSSVQEIKVIRSRRIPADLAVIRMTNIGGNLLDRFFERSEVQRMAEEKQAERPVGILADTDYETPFDKMMLQPGVKTQIRLGYAADPDQLETVFLGQITEVMPAEDGNIIEIVCQGYGAELEAERCGDTEDSTIVYSAQEALSSAILHSSIVHFGRQEPNKKYNPSAVRSYATGGTGWDLLDPFAIIKDWFRTAEEQSIRKYGFLNEPQDDNIFAPPITYYLDGWSVFWNNAAAYRPIESTPWEIFKEHELRLPGYVSLAVPYGHSPRMTMFFGARGQNYWARPQTQREEQQAYLMTRHLGNITMNDKVEALQDPRSRAILQRLRKSDPNLYRVMVHSLSSIGGDKSMGFYLGRIFGRYRPFRNYHIYTSEHHILSNNIRTNATGTYNTVEIGYSSKEKILDYQSKKNKAKVFNQPMPEMSIEANAVYTTKLNDTIPDDLIRKYEESYPSCITEYMAMRYAQGLMIRGLKDVYRGDLCVVGDETLKPYDICMLQDNINDMYGPCEVEQVVHIFNRDRGFVSIITPDLCIDTSEFTSKGVMDAMIQTQGYVWAFAGRDIPIGRLQKAVRMGKSESAKFIGAISPMVGAAMMMHFDQTGSPYVITPLNLGGKPMLGLALAPKTGRWFQNVWGEWKQYTEDFKEGWSATDITEDLLEMSLELGDWGRNITGIGRAKF